MKVKVVCKQRSETEGSHGGPLYSYVFKAELISADMKIQKVNVQFTITSVDPLPYKYGGKYTVDTPSSIMLL